MLKMKNTKCIIDIHGENFVVNQIVYDYIRELERELDELYEREHIEIIDHTAKSMDELIKNSSATSPFDIEKESAEEK